MTLPRARTPLAALAFAVFAWLVLWLTWPIDAIHFDSSRDLLMARDCYALGQCDGHGPPTSFDGLFQGVLWTNALGLMRWLGLMPAAIGAWLAALDAAVIAVSMRWARDRHAPLLPVFLLGGAVAMVPVVLWSPTLFLPAMVLTTWLTLQWLEVPRWPLALGLGLLWGVTLDLYLAAGPVLLATVALGVRARRPGQTAVIVLLALAVGLLVSPGAWSATWQFVPAHPLRVAMVLSAFGALLWLAVRLPRLEPIGLLAFSGVGAWLVIGLVHHFESRYLMPGFPAACLYFAARVPRHCAVHVVAVAITALLAARFIPHPLPQMRYTNAARLADAMQAHGIGWPQALAHGQGAWGRQLAPATGIFLPRDPTPWQGEDVAIELMQDAQFRTVPTRMQLDKAQSCVVRADGETCGPLPLEPSPPKSAYPFAVRVYAAILPRVPSEVTQLRLTVPVRAGEPEVLQLLPQFVGDACPWTSPGGAREVSLGADATTVVLTREFTPHVCPEGQASYDWLPPWLEVPRNPARAFVLKPPPAPTALIHPILPATTQPQFARLAALLAADTTLRRPEPDVAVHNESARVVWPEHPPLELRHAPTPPWFFVLAPERDVDGSAAVVRALPRAFAANPWQEADAALAATRFTGKPMWPHLTLAALGLLALLVAAWRLGR